MTSLQPSTTVVFLKREIQTNNVGCHIAEVEVKAAFLEADAVLRDQLAHLPDDAHFAWMCGRTHRCSRRVRPHQDLQMR